MSALRDLIIQARELVGDLRRLVSDLRAEKSGYLDWPAAAAYTGLSVSTLRRITPAKLKYRVGERKVLLRKSEIDDFLEQYREPPEHNLHEVAERPSEQFLNR